MTPAPTLDAYPVVSTDKVRYGDTDRQGHVNNAVFVTYFETGRVELLFDPAAPLLDAGHEFVVAQIVLNFRAEIHWPGSVHSGTRVLSVGNSSLKLEQALFQDERWVASAETVMVQIDTQTRRASPLSALARERLAAR